MLLKTPPESTGIKPLRDSITLLTLYHLHLYRAHSQVPLHDLPTFKVDEETTVELHAADLQRIMDRLQEVDAVVIAHCSEGGPYCLSCLIHLALSDCLEFLLQLVTLEKRPATPLPLYVVFHRLLIHAQVIALATLAPSLCPVPQAVLSEGIESLFTQFLEKTHLAAQNTFFTQWLVATASVKGEDVLQSLTDTLSAAPPDDAASRAELAATWKAAFGD